MAVAQGLLTRVLIPWLGGERRAALAGMAAALVGYLGYALATEGWMMYAVALSTFIFALSYPSMNAIASKQAPRGRAGGIAGRHRLPLQSERHPGSAADDPDLPLLFRRHRAGAFPRARRLSRPRH